MKRESWDDVWLPHPSWWMAPPVRQRSWDLDTRKRAAQEQLRAQAQREEELSAERKRRRLESLAGEVEDLRADLAGIVQRLRAVERRLSVGAVVIDLCDGPPCSAWFDSMRVRG